MSNLFKTLTKDEVENFDEFMKFPSDDNGELINEEYMKYAVSKTLEEVGLFFKSLEDESYPEAVYYPIFNKNNGIKKFRITTTLIPIRKKYLR